MEKFREYVKKHRLLSAVLLTGLFSMLLLLLVRWVVFGNKEEVDYNTFMAMTAAGEIGQVKIKNEDIFFTDREGEHRYRCIRLEDPELVERLYAAGVDFHSVFRKDMPESIALLLGFAITTLLVLGFYTLLSKMLGMKAEISLDLLGIEGLKQEHEPLSTGLRFSDVAGQEEAAELLWEIVDYLKTPDKYKKIGARIPRGALLVGPPGTGKTLLAGAVAGEADVPFFAVSGSEFVELYAGLGAKRVRELFKKAREAAPCILFIDEIDAIGKRRRKEPDGDASEEWEQTLNQLLIELDGLRSAEEVVLLGATNRPEALDPALLRPGRFDRQIPVELPDRKGREAILKIHAQRVEREEGLDFSAIARAAVGASGADLANLINEAALGAIRKGRSRVSQEDLEESLELLLTGVKKKNPILSPKEKRIAACHEMGHALLAYLQDPEMPIHRISIIPRLNGALGYTLQLEEKEKCLLEKRDLENRLCVYAAGRAAEELVFQSITTGASNDSREATKLARAMVCSYGMGKGFGMAAFSGLGSGEPDCSFETQAGIDREILRLLEEAYERAKGILSGNLPKLQFLAGHLLERECLSGEEFRALLDRYERAKCCL